MEEGIVDWRMGRLLRSRCQRVAHGIPDDSRDETNPQWGRNSDGRGGSLVGQMEKRREMVKPGVRDRDESNENRGKSPGEKRQITS